MILPEYGRHVQKMLEQVCEIEDREKRTQQAQAVVNVMGTLNPHMRDYPDYKHKLWDHAHIISGYRLDVDGPYEAPVKEEHESKPEPIGYSTEPIRKTCYGRNIQNCWNGQKYALVKLGLIASPFTYAQEMDSLTDEAKARIEKCLEEFKAELD